MVVRWEALLVLSLVVGFAGVEVDGGTIAMVGVVTAGNGV